MSYRIFASDVRNRLRTMVDAEVSDDLLYSSSYIPVSEAWLNQVLSDNSLSYSTLSSDKQTMAKAAQIARCAWIVLNSAPKEAFKGGLTEFKGVDSTLLENMMKSLKSEWKSLLGSCGASVAVVGGGYSGGDDYQPDLEDETNVHWSDEDSDGYTRFS